MPELERTKIESLIRRDRLIICIGLASITAVAWVYILDLARTMSSTDMTGMDIMKAAAVPDVMSWNLRGFILTFIMWSVMMVAMMIPSSAPMVLQFASMHRNRDNQHSIVVVITFFVFGYLVVWTLFSGLATLAQCWLHSVALLSSEMAVMNRTLGGVLFVMAGLFQWTGMKHRSLNNCRSPIGFFLTEWREGRAGAVAMGMKHGCYCLGCCLLLTATLFVVGIMNIVWVGVLAGLVLIEKLTKAGPVIARIVGGAMVAWGAWMILTGLRV
jgi:predicted metal-binding membrane protein